MSGDEEGREVVMRDFGGNERVAGAAGPGEKWAASTLDQGLPIVLTLKYQRPDRPKVTLLSRMVFAAHFLLMTMFRPYVIIKLIDSNELLRWKVEVNAWSDAPLPNLVLGGTAILSLFICMIEVLLVIHLLAFKSGLMSNDRALVKFRAVLDRVLCMILALSLCYKIWFDVVDMDVVWIAAGYVMLAVSSQASLAIFSSRYTFVLPGNAEGTSAPIRSRRQGVAD